MNKLTINFDEYADKQSQPMCTRCNTPRYVVCDGKAYRCLCKCQSEEVKQSEQKDNEQKRLANFRKRQQFALMGKNYFNADFVTAVKNDSNIDIYRSCYRYCTKAEVVIKNNLGLYIVGDNSSGKTHLIACMCNFLIKNGYSCIFTSFQQIVNDLFSNPDKKTSLIHQLATTKFLFIDDFGKELLGRETNPNLSKSIERQIFEVISMRYSNSLPIIFTSNYEMSELADVLKLDKSILERVNENSAKILRLNGANFRDAKLKQKEKLLKEIGI